MRMKRGMSLVEVLMGLTLGATLLLAVATAVHASSRAMTNNEQFFKATQGARLSLLNIGTTLRTSEAAELGGTTPDLSGEGPVAWPASQQLDLTHTVIDKVTGTPVTQRTSYKLVQATEPDRLYNLVLERNGKQMVLARNVADLDFTGMLHKRAYIFCDTCNIQMDRKDPVNVGDPEWYECPKVPAHTSGPIWDLANVQIQMTVQLGTNAVVMSNSVVPRKVMVVR